MDNKLNIEQTEIYKDKIKENFKEMATEELYDKWADTFEVSAIDKNRVVIAYHGSLKLKEFKKECGATLLYCIYSILGANRSIKISKKKNEKTVNTKIGKNFKALKFFVIGMFFVCVATAIILVLCNYIGNRNFRETFYTTSSIKVDSNVRVIQLSDLHSVYYGKNNNKLLDRIKALEPDIIICTGDIVDSAKEDVDYAVNLGKALSEIAPSYYVYGNNEVEGIYDFVFNFITSSP